MIYEWKGGFPTHGAKPEEVGRHCQKLRKLNGGKLTARLIVDDAISLAAPTHVCFQWDDRIAADEHRLHQARTLLRSITVRKHEQDEPMPMFVNVQFADDEERSYTSVEDAIQDPELREQLLDQARREIIAWRKKYAQYKELAAVFDVIDAQLELVA